MKENKGKQPEQELVKIIEGFSDFYHSYKNIEPEKSITTIIQEYVRGLYTCETCNGDGSVEKNIQRDGYPEKDVPVVCSDCGGTGKAAAQPSKVQEKEERPKVDWEMEYWKQFNENDGLKKEIEELKSWKQSAISVMPDMQAIGKALNVPLGQSVHDKILPGIEKLKGSIIRALNMTTMTWSEKKDFLKSNNL